MSEARRARRSRRFDRSRTAVSAERIDVRRRMPALRATRRGPCPQWDVHSSRNTLWCRQAMGRVDRGPRPTRRADDVGHSCLHTLRIVRAGKKDRTTPSTEPPVGDCAGEEVGVTREGESTTATLARRWWAFAECRCDTHRLEVQRVALLFCQKNPNTTRARTMTPKTSMRLLLSCSG